MPTPELGRIEQVSIREVWPHEEYNFTPWLADNLYLLGDALGMKLELDQREAAVGPYSLDILAREADTGVLVAIENQLEETDHSHLGQLLTYATGCGAHIAIWVAPEFGYEHAEALHRLNEWTRERIRFYGVKIKVIKKADDECRVPRFRKVVYPGGWDKENTLGQWEMPERIRRYYNFFQPLITELLGMSFADKAVYQFDHTGRFFPSRLNPNIGYAASLEKKNDAWVTFHVRTEDRELTNRIFDALKEQQAQIENCLGAKWHWQRWDAYTFSSINLRRDGSINDPPEKRKRPEPGWCNQLPKLKEVLDPHLERVLKELQPEGPAGAEA